MSIIHGFHIYKRTDCTKFPSKLEEEWGDFLEHLRYILRRLLSKKNVCVQQLHHHAARKLLNC